MPFGALRLRRFSDAPLALLIGTPAKRVKEIGAPSLKHPFARVFPALVAPSPLANLKGRNAVAFHRQPKILAAGDRLAIALSIIIMLYRD
jgi:hypothetical protein